MTTLTTFEAQVLEAFRQAGVDACGASSAESMIDDNMTWCRASDLSKATGIPTKSIRGVMASLSKKDLAADSGESMEGGVTKANASNNDWYLTDAGIRLAWERVAGVGAEADDGPLPATITQPDAIFAVEFSWHRTTAKMSKVAALRSIAGPWAWTRKEFIDAAVKYGINRHTASTQWQAGRKGA